MKLYDVTIFGYFWGSEQGQRFAPHSPRHPELRKDSFGSQTRSCFCWWPDDMRQLSSHPPSAPFNKLSIFHLSFTASKFILNRPTPYTSATRREVETTRSPNHDRNWFSAGRQAREAMSRSQFQTKCLNEQQGISDSLVTMAVSSCC